MPSGRRGWGAVLLKLCEPKELPRQPSAETAANTAVAQCGANADNVHLVCLRRCCAQQMDAVERCAKPSMMVGNTNCCG